MSEKITCAKCGSVYELSYTRTIMRDRDSVDCRICGEELYSWSEAKIWEAKLIEEHANHLPRPPENA
jgi:ribosomal protein S27E